MKGSPATTLLILLQLTGCIDSCLAGGGRPIPAREQSGWNIEYVTKSCETTLYPQLCRKSLVIYANKIQSSPRLLADTALSVTLTATESTSALVKNLTRTSHGLKPVEVQALRDCMEELGDSVYELQRSIHEMAPTAAGSAFQSQIDDVKTWVSAALTDDDTCMDGFSRTAALDGGVKDIVRGHVMKVAHLTSIALTFINNYGDD